MKKEIEIYVGDNDELVNISGTCAVKRKDAEGLTFINLNLGLSEIRSADGVLLKASPVVFIKDGEC